MDVNSCTFVGNLTRDPEIKYVNHNGEQKAVCSFSIANNPTADNGKQASFFEITVWGKVAESCQKYLTKGKKVCVVCEARLDQWTDKTSGQKRQAVKFTASKVQFLSPIEKSDDGQGSAPHGQSRPATTGPKQNTARGQVNEFLDDPGAAGASDEETPF